MIAKEPKCLRCGIELDPAEYSDPSEVDCCGYCFTDVMNTVRAKRTGFASGLNDCGIHREIAIQAQVEIMIEQAELDKKTDVVEALQRIIRIIEA